VGAPLERQTLDYLRLLRQVPAVTDVSYLDATGKERLRISRLALDVMESQQDFSRDPKFVEAKSRKRYFGPVSFREESEPYMTISMSGSGPEAGVVVAELNLKFICEVISRIKMGAAGHAYVVDSSGNLIADPDIAWSCGRRIFPRWLRSVRRSARTAWPIPPRRRRSRRTSADGVC
jgi:hypothetical protein